MKRLRLRYFTEREVANIMGFPKHFQFPSGNKTLSLSTFKPEPPNPTPQQKTRNSDRSTLNDRHDVSWLSSGVSSAWKFAERACRDDTSVLPLPLDLCRQRA